MTLSLCIYIDMYLYYIHIFLLSDMAHRTLEVFKPRHRIKEVCCVEGFSSQTNLCWSFVVLFCLHQAPEKMISRCTFACN